MYEYRVDVGTPLSALQVREAQRRLFFVDSAITDFAFEGPGDGAVAVTVYASRELDPQVLHRRLNLMLDTDVRSGPLVPAGALWTSPHRRSLPADRFADLVERGIAIQTGTGRVSLAQPAITLVETLDQLLRDIAVVRFGATEYRYPTLISLDAMQRSRYLAAFPQYSMFVTRPRADIDSYRSLAAASAAAESGASVGGTILDHCEGVELVLPPTMCYHTFDQFAGAQLAAEGLAVTARGPSFRHESRYHRSLERLADFTIREVVFLGAPDFVGRARDQIRGAALELVDTIGLQAWCEVANDPFFAAPGGAAQGSAQRLLDLKHELRADVAPGRSIAIGSFNLHYRSFGTAFGITTASGEVASTACAGFGLERLAYAFLCQFDTDPGGWPDPVRVAFGRISSLDGAAQ
jgi:seryl-tRNA synthetase